MNFNNEDKRIIKRNIVILLVAILTIAIIINFKSVLDILKTIWNITFPFILGVGMAFIINIPMNAIEKYFLSKIKIKNDLIKRALSIIISLLIIFGLLILVISIALPQLIESITNLVTMLPDFINKTLENIKSNAFFSEYFLDINEFINEIDFSKISNIIITYLQKQQFQIGDAFSTLMNIVNGFANFFIALVFSIYCLASKEKLIKQFKELIYTILNEDTGDKIVHVGKVFQISFHNFFTGQFTEAVLLGVLTFIGMVILKLPFSNLVSLIIGFGALIPIFGAVIAAAIGALIIAIESPIKSLIFIVFIVILQQIDGNFIYPKVVGKQVGLPPMWVLVAITIGGSILGVVGMLIGVPISSTIYVLLKEYKNAKLKEKNINILEK